MLKWHPRLIAGQNDDRSALKVNMPSDRNVTVADAVAALSGLELHLWNEGMPTPLSAQHLHLLAWGFCAGEFKLPEGNSQQKGISLEIPQRLGWDTHSVFSPKAPCSLRSRAPRGSWLDKAVFVRFPAFHISFLHFPWGFLGLPPKETPGAAILVPPRASIQRIWSKMVPFTDPSLTQDSIICAPRSPKGARPVPRHSDSIFQPELFSLHFTYSWTCVTSCCL